MSFITPSAGQIIRATHVAQFVQWITGQKLDSPGLIAATSTTEYALTVRSQDGATGLAMAVQYGSASSPTNIALFNKAGITFSVPTTFASAAVVAGAFSVPGEFNALGSTAASSAGGFKVFGPADGVASAAAWGTVGIGAAGQNLNHTFTVHRITNFPQNMVMFDWIDEGLNTDSSTTYIKAEQGDAANEGNFATHIGYSAVRPIVAVVKRNITSDTPGFASHVATYGPLFNYYPITGASQGTRIVEIGLASMVGKSSVTEVDANVGIYLMNQAYGQFTEGMVGIKGDNAIVVGGIDNWTSAFIWVGPAGYPGNQRYPDNAVGVGQANSSVSVTIAGTVGTVGSRVTPGGDPTTPYYILREPGRIGIWTNTPLAPFHAKAPSSSAIATFNYPVVTNPASMIRVDQDSTAVAPSQIIVNGLAGGETAGQLLIGYNHTSDYGHFQAVKNAAVQTLAMQVGGGKVGVGTASVSAKLHVFPTTGTEVVFQVQGQATQSANLVQFSNSAGTVLTSFNTAGVLGYTNASNFSAGAGGATAVNRQVGTDISTGPTTATAQVWIKHQVTGTDYWFMGFK
jgi:hypothetical protein